MCWCSCCWCCRPAITWLRRWWRCSGGCGECPWMPIGSLGVSLVIWIAGIGMLIIGSDGSTIPAAAAAARSPAYMSVAERGCSICWPATPGIGGWPCRPWCEWCSELREWCFNAWPRTPFLCKVNFNRSSGIWQGIESWLRFSPDFVRTVTSFLWKLSSCETSSSAWSPVGESISASFFCEENTA